VLGFVADGLGRLQFAVAALRRGEGCLGWWAVAYWMKY
jgi:hypothetical protein